MLSMLATFASPVKYIVINIVNLFIIFQIHNLINVEVFQHVAILFVLVMEYRCSLFVYNYRSFIIVIVSTSKSTISNY
jgi:hypothetical protein